MFHQSSIFPGLSTFCYSDSCTAGLGASGGLDAPFKYYRYLSNHKGAECVIIRMSAASAFLISHMSEILMGLVCSSLRPVFLWTKLIYNRY